MSRDVLVPGSVVPYVYLWHEQQRQGRTSGTKQRPCLVADVDDELQPGSLIVTLVPLTTKDPGPERRTDAILIPEGLRKRLDLGREFDTSWIITTEANRFTWPEFNYDLGSTRDGRTSYGRLYPKELAAVSRILLENSERGNFVRVDRDD